MQNIEIVIKKNENKVFPFVWINSDEEEVVIDARLVGEGARLSIIGIFVGADQKHITFNTNIVHEAKNTYSRTTLRGVFKDHSVFSNDGLVRINKGAKGADGFFDSKVLLFDDAKGRSVPSLEIDENELKAGHASTVGRPDAEQIFYLRSRGLSEEEAEKLIVSGFFTPILKQFSKDKQLQLSKRIEEML
ncbi:MAG: SufD family Fe-S cluster assembly protein [Candidatus Levybacteria bacterium]|nr:SufD family Fe-S cluster assembly protein [Candidatus Levybacteria bacterium]